MIKKMPSGCAVKIPEEKTGKTTEKPERPDSGLLKAGRNP